MAKSIPAKAGTTGVPKKRTEARAKAKANSGRLKAEFVAALRNIGVMRYACDQVKVGKSTVARWRAADPAFEAAVLEALDDAVEVMEREAFRRAVVGTEKPITVAGQREVIRDFSDVLLIFLLKANRPEKYRERYEYQHSGPAGGPIQVQEMMRLASAELDRQDREEASKR